MEQSTPRTGPTGVFIDPAVGQFALDAANCYTAYFRATGSPSSRVTFIAKGYLLISRARAADVPAGALDAEERVPRTRLPSAATKAIELGVKTRIA